MNAFCTLLILLVSSLLCSDPVPESEQGTVRLNQVQLIGSHNSYKIAIEQPLLDYLTEQNPATGRSLQYEHIPMTEQLALGLRSLELDVFHDPEGGYYANPAGLDIVRASGNSPAPFDPEGKLNMPGLKVFHVQDIDFRSHQLLFSDALMELLAWSEDNPEHIPIIITINAKDGKIPGLRVPLPFDAGALQNLDTEIKQVIPAEKLISPDLVRGDKPTLEQAVLTNGWPLLDAVRGRFLFVLDESKAKTDLYLQQFPGLKEAALFVNKETGDPVSAFHIINDPVESFDKIRSLVAKGYIVRTRADANTEEARTNDYTRFEKAKASGAQVITTDYYLPGKLFESGFQVVFGNDEYERIKD